jgi:hypothetical protein
MKCNPKVVVSTILGVVIKGFVLNIDFCSTIEVGILLSELGLFKSIGHCICMSCARYLLMLNTKKDTPGSPPWVH